MDNLGQFGGGFFAAPGGAMTRSEPFGQFGGGFMMRQVQVVQGPLAYYPYQPKKKGKKKAEPSYFWPLQGPSRHHAPYGYMGPGPYGM